MAPLIALILLSCGAAPPRAPVDDGGATATPASTVEAAAPAALDWDPASAFPPAPAPVSMVKWSTGPAPEAADSALSATALLATGRTRRDAGDLEAARQLFAEAARRAPAVSDGHVELARTLVAMRQAGPAAICGRGASLNDVFDALARAVAADPSLPARLGDDHLLDPLAPLSRFRLLRGVDMLTAAGADGVVLYGPPAGVWGSVQKVALRADGGAAWADFDAQPDGGRTWSYSVGTWTPRAGGWRVEGPRGALSVSINPDGSFTTNDGAWSDAASECGA